MKWATLLSIVVSLKFIVLVGKLAICVKLQNFRNREEGDQGERIMAWVG